MAGTLKSFVEQPQAQGSSETPEGPTPRAEVNVDDRDFETSSIETKLLLLRVSPKLPRIRSQPGTRDSACRAPHQNLPAPFRGIALTGAQTKEQPARNVDTCGRRAVRASPIRRAS